MMLADFKFDKEWINLELVTLRLIYYTTLINLTQRLWFCQFFCHSVNFASSK